MELGVATVGATLVADDAGHRHAVVGVTAQDGIDAGDPAGQLQIHIHAVMRQQHHHLRALRMESSRRGLADAGGRAGDQDDSLGRRHGRSSKVPQA